MGRYVYGVKLADESDRRITWLFFKEVIVDALIQLLYLLLPAVAMLTVAFQAQLIYLKGTAVVAPAVVDAANVGTLHWAPMEEYYLGTYVLFVATTIGTLTTAGSAVASPLLAPPPPPPPALALAYYHPLEFRHLPTPFYARAFPHSYHSCNFWHHARVSCLCGTHRLCPSGITSASGILYGQVVDHQLAIHTIVRKAFGVCTMLYVTKLPCPCPVRAWPCGFQLEA